MSADRDENPFVGELSACVGTLHITDQNTFIQSIHTKKSDECMLCSALHEGGLTGTHLNILGIGKEAPCLQRRAKVKTISCKSTILKISIVNFRLLITQRAESRGGMHLSYLLLGSQSFAAPFLPSPCFLLTLPAFVVPVFRAAPFASTGAIRNLANPLWASQRLLLGPT